MRQLDLVPNGALTSSMLDCAIAFSFPLSPTDRQVDVVYFDRPGEIHVNLALGRLCPIGCPECSATLLNQRLAKALSGNLSPAAISQKVRSILTNLTPLLTNHSLVISGMNDGDPLSRTPEEVIAIVQGIFRTCEEMGVMLDRLNLETISNRGAITPPRLPKRLCWSSRDTSARRSAVGLHSTPGLAPARGGERPSSSSASAAS
jgi:hypothetical protein